MPRNSLRRELRRNTVYRNVSAGTRDTIVLLREFAPALTLLALAVLLGGLLYQRLHLLALPDEPYAYAEAVFLVLSMIFLQANVDFPTQWYLQAFFFAMPVVGLAIVGLGAADFGALFFNRKARGGAWQVAIASLYSRHVILVGLGHVGYKVVRELHNLGEDVVVIEADPNNRNREAVAAMGYPIITDDARRSSVLEKAGVARAEALVLCTSNDSTNLQMALKVREMNRNIRVVVRVFDEDFAQALENNMAIDQAFSSSALAAPAIAAAAIESDLIPPISLAGRLMSMSRYTIRQNSGLRGQPVGEIEAFYDVSVVLLERNGAIDLHPADEIVLDDGDVLAIFADRETLSRITRANRGR